MLDYEDDGSNPVPEDLVISSLKDVKHLARRGTNFGNCNLILGAVIGFKGVPIKAIEVWKNGFTFLQYKGKRVCLLTGCQSN